MIRLLVLGALVGCGGGGGEDAGPVLPDVDYADQATNTLILFLDDVGTDKVGTWQEHPKAPETPVLDALGDVGVRFRHAYAAPVCSPARAALLTGRTARRTGLGDFIETDGHQALPLDEVLLPEHLDGSVATGAFGKWHLAGSGAPGWRTHALDQGFDVAQVTPGNLGTAYVPGNGPVDYDRWERLDGGELSIDTRYATAAQVNDAGSWIATTSEPWVAYVAFSAAHAPYQTPPDRLLPEPLGAGAPDTDRYDAVLRALDTEIGRLLSEMDPEVLARTQILVMGDNGTPGEAVREPWSFAAAKNTMYEGGTNVPLVVAGAGVAADGRWSDALVHVVDLLPTVLEAHGASPKAPLDGLALQPLLVDPDAPWEREVLFTERFVPIGPPPGAREEIAARGARYKLLEVRLDGELSRQSLYDLSGRFDDGPDLLLGTLSEQEQEALTRLSAAIEAYRSTPYDG